MNTVHANVHRQCEKKTLSFQINLKKEKNVTNKVLLILQFEFFIFKKEEIK